VPAPELPRLSAEDALNDMVGALDESGAVVVEGLLNPDLLDRFNAELDPLLESSRPDHDRAFVNPAIAWFFGEHTRHVTGIAGKSSVFAAEILTHSILMGVSDAVLGPNCARYQLNVAHILDRGPGGEAQILHRDELVWVHMPRPHPELQVASMVALVDFTADNGATLIVPGSHRWEHARQATPDEIIPAEMPAGSAVIYLGSTIHAGGANTTRGDWRRGLHLSYVLGWLRTEENHYLSTPPEKASALPGVAQELLGYAVHDAIDAGGGYLGAVDLRDPMEMFAHGELLPQNGALEE
jgi:ectoine hydroxylase-related dioxygenase (phytanoyl-CoA dioxygenase family)